MVKMKYLALYTKIWCDWSEIDYFQQSYFVIGLALTLFKYSFHFFLIFLSASQFYIHNSAGNVPDQEVAIGETFIVSYSSYDTQYECTDMGELSKIDRIAQ